MTDITPDRPASHGPPFEVPPFQPPTPPAITYVWWSWHPLYPYWAKSCWGGATIEGAQEHLNKGRLKHYHNKLIRHDGISLVEVQDEPCREMEVWHKIKRQFDDGSRKPPVITKP